MTDLVVIGAGVVGLAIAREASQSGLETIAVSYTHLTLPTILLV